ncbi:aldehyde dehydrogenase [Patellaria atrata CBS 101060]|uniref:aldehyde dehydrogenase (NAD(+)) n=1 Tax=Patellaria atrata CBS 101060 TaxID=1346257 RepID=A0A9P4SGA7_9PEZI|nr:aldehyde dehydrogenase [Patellaria atrata CBS 101060]
MGATTNGTSTNGTNGTVANPIETRLFIDGKFVDASDKGTFKLYSPRTREQVAEVAEATVEDVDAAVAAAKKAQPAWEALSPFVRGAYMKKLAALIRENHDELAALEAKSMGKPVSAYIDSHAAAWKFEYYSEAAMAFHGSTSLHTPGFINITLKQPFGVAAAIIPWNLPLLFFGHKVAPAIAAGNCIVLKSSEKAPLTSIKVAQLIEKVGFPPGVINVISGHGPVSGSALSTHMDVRVISFTGSGRTGRIIQAAAAKSNLKNVILELGGKSPAVVFDDANFDDAVKATAKSVYWNSGQVCIANSRIYVQDTIAEKFVTAFNEEMKAVVAGDPLDKETALGPVADEKQYEIINEYIKSGKEAGGKLQMGGAEADTQRNGYVIKPTVFLETPDDAKMMREEIFGPVVNISAFKTEEEVLARANNTEYGLFAAVFTKNIDRALRMAKNLESGIVGVNCTSPNTTHDLPFGGIKSSGLGREGIHNSMENFTETKTVVIKIDS